jgi:hypothetical protein
VSGLAVAALIAGCGSALVLFTSLAAVVPLLAIVMALTALADLRRSEGRRVGRPAALAGLALAIGFTAQAAAAAAIERWLAGRRAAATAGAWIEAVGEERFADAIGLCTAAALPDFRRDPFEPPPSEAERLAAFRAMPAVATVAGCSTIRTPVAVERDPGIEAGWLARAAVADCGRDGGTLILRVEPRLSSRGRQPIERWLVTSVELQD